MAQQEEKLPCELTEEILSHVPPISLVRFRTVSKRWNSLFNENTFINNHKATFRFIIATNTKIYSVSIDPKIVVRELPLEFPSGLVESNHMIRYLNASDEFLIFGTDKGVSVLNPWLNQSRWTMVGAGEDMFRCKGIGYDSVVGEKSVYKTIWSYRKGLDRTKWKIHNLASDTWKNIKWYTGGDEVNFSNHRGIKQSTLHSTRSVSLNGTLYWVAFSEGDDPFYNITYFDFSKEGFFTYCYLPCRVNHVLDALVLSVFKGDRFSLLKQCHATKKVEIWVTKEKINAKDGRYVVWLNFMTFSIPSYFIDDKRLVVCSCDENGQAWIYVLEGNKLVNKVKLHSVADSWPLHCTYFPSLVILPRGPVQEVV
ncbi:unnamed protein product [Cochlearia groenlandica]